MEREKEINAGPSWPFPDLSAGECVIDQTFQSKYNLTIGEKIAWYNSFSTLFETVAQVYNSQKEALQEEQSTDFFYWTY